MMGTFHRLAGPRWAWLGLLTLSFPGSLFAQEGGIELFAAETLFNGGTRVSLSRVYRAKRSLYRGSDEVPDPIQSKLTEERLVVSIDHGARPDLTLSALIPVVYKDFEANTGDRSSFGLGDLALLAKYRVNKRDWRRGSYNISTIGGLELPTGGTYEADGGSRLAPALQPGQGAWNPFVGLAGHLDMNRVRFDGLAFFKFNTKGAQELHRGNFYSFELDAAYRFYQTKYPGPTASAKLGVQWRDEARARQAGARVLNSGAEQLLLRLGLGWHPAPAVDITLGVDLPLHQELGGAQLGLDYRMVLAAGLRF